MADPSKLQSNEEAQSNDKAQSKNNTQTKMGIDVDRIEEHNDELDAKKKSNPPSTPVSPSRPRQQSGGSLFRAPNVLKWIPGGAHLRPFAASDGAPLRTGNTPSPRSPNDPDFLAARHSSQIDETKDVWTGEAKIEKRDAGEAEGEYQAGAAGQQEERDRSRLPNSYRRTPTPHPLTDSEDADTGDE